MLETLSRKKMQRLIHDPVKSAKAVNLVYVTDLEPGIKRVKGENGFSYWLNDEEIEDEETLRRIKKLAIPPAWENVWICASENGHLQATGIDSKNRKQYRYHTLWNQVRNQTKFLKMIEFGQALPAMRLQVEKDLAKSGLPPEKVLAAIVSIMERTTIRVGNNAYEKLYGSFGLTTMKDRHVKIEGTQVRFIFKGKKGIKHDINLRSKRLANIVKRCKDIPGKELFQYYDDEGNKKAVDSGMVNDYIRKISNGDFTTKDFRTWVGTVQAFLALKELGLSETQKGTQKFIVSALEKVSQHLGNTRNVCKKYYVHPAIVSLYESKSLNEYWKELESIETNDNRAGLTPEEQIVMKILHTATP